MFTTIIIENWLGQFDVGGHYLYDKYSRQMRLEDGGARSVPMVP
jgi:hypothetical protein